MSRGPGTILMPTRRRPIGQGGSDIAEALSASVFSNCQRSVDLKARTLLYISLLSLLNILYNIYHHRHASF